jgi:hypothetical protein
VRFAPALLRTLSGDLSRLGGPSVDEDVAGRVRAEQISVLFHYLPWMMLANASNALIFVAAFRTSADWTWALAWAVLIVVYALSYGIRPRGERHARPISVSTVLSGGP